MPSWLGIFSVFNNFGVAFIVTLLFISSCIAFFAMTAFDPRPLHIFDCLIGGYNLMLCLPYPYVAKRATTKLYLMYCTICSMLVAIHYLSFYTAFLITPRREFQATNINELFENDFKLASDLETILMLKTNWMVRDSYSRYSYSRVFW